MTQTARIGPVLACAALALAAVAAYGEWVRLPHLFPGSDALLLSLFAVGLTIALALMLPNRVVFSEQEMLRETLRQRGAGSAENAERVIERIIRARDFARRLRRADNGFRQDLRDVVDEVAGDLDEIALRILERPDDASEVTQVLARAGLAVEAVERHAEIRAESAEQTEDLVQESRARVIATLRHLADVMDAKMRQRVIQKVTGVEVTTSVADDLYESMKGNDR